MINNKKNLTSLNKSLDAVKENTSLSERIDVWLAEATARVESHTALIHAKLDRRRDRNNRLKDRITIAPHRRSWLSAWKMKHDSDALIAPPQLGKYLIYLAFPRKNREVILGDLEEDFREVHREFGLTRAKIHYYVQVLRSILPAIKELVNIVSHIRRFITTM